MSLHTVLSLESGHSTSKDGSGKRKSEEVIELDLEEDENDNEPTGEAKQQPQASKPQETTLLDSSDDEKQGAPPVARERGRGTSDKGRKSFFPIRLTATTTSRTLPSNVKQYFMPLREMIGLQPGRGHQWLIISNFLIDFSYLCEQTEGDLFQFQRVVVFYGSSGSNCGNVMQQWKQLLQGTGRTVEFIKLVPSDPPKSKTNPLSQKIEYGVHHTKMFITGYEEFGNSYVRIAVHTANLLRSDVELKTQGVYAQDFPLKLKDKTEANLYKRQRLETVDYARQFEDDLVSYLESYRYQTRQSWCSGCLPNGLSGQSMSLLELVRQYDYSSSYAVLVPSVPGRHEGPREMHSFGYLKLRKAVIENVCPGKSRQSTSKPLLCQFSSIGSLSANWLGEFVSSIDFTTARLFDPVNPPARKGNVDLSARMKIIWPTVEEIRSCEEGYAGGGAIPGRMKNLDKEFLRPLFHRWSSRNKDDLRTARHAPHIKTFVQPSSDGRSIDWLVLTSHNLSTAAWGQVQKRSVGSTERILFIRHWELGVFISPETLQRASGDDSGEVRLVPFTGSAIGPDTVDSGHESNDVCAALPYGLSPTPYNPEDVSWACDRPAIMPDRFGRVMG